MKNQIRLFLLILLLGNHVALPMKMLAQRFTCGLAAAARVGAIKPTVLCSKAIKCTSAIAPNVCKPIMAMPVRCMGLIAHNIVLKDLHQRGMAPKDFNILLGSHLINEPHKEPVTYAIDEQLFMNLCVQAAKTQKLDQKPLYELITRVTKLQKAQLDRTIIHDAAKDMLGMQLKPNYGTIQLTREELAEGLLDYIPWNGIVRQTATSYADFTSKCSVWLNGQQATLRCEPATKSVVTDAQSIDAVIVKYVPVQGQKCISAEGLRFRWDFGLDVLAEFNQLVEKVEKTDK